MEHYNNLKDNLKNISDKKNQMNGLDLLALFEDNQIPAVFFDPQYRGVLDKLNYGNEGARQKGRANLEQMSEEVIQQFIELIDKKLTPSGHLFLWIDKFHLVEGVKPWFKDTNLELVDMLTWNKMKIGMGYRTRRTSEYLVVLQKTPKRAKGVWTLHNIPDTWNEKVKAVHPHSKPELLQAALIKSVVKEGDFVVDPSSGGYSVMRSALSCNRHFIGCDLLPVEKDI